MTVRNWWNRALKSNRSVRPASQLRSYRPLAEQLETRLTPAGNNTFASASTFSGDSGTDFDINFFSDGETGEPDHLGVSAPLASQWWKWTPSADDTAVIDTFGSTFNTTLAIYTGSAVDSLTFIAGNDDAGTGNTSQAIFTATGGTTYYIVVDGNGSSTGIIVLNVFLGDPPPVADAGPLAYNVDEGSSVLLDGTASTDVGTIVSYEWDLDYDGSNFDVNATGATTNFNAFLINGPGLVNVALRVTDDNGSSDTDTALVIINNAPPNIISVTNNGPINEGSSVTVTVVATDPSLTDFLSLQYEFDFDNDGTFEVGPQSSNQATGVIGDNGARPVNVRVRDDVGSTTGSTTVTVNNVAPVISGVSYVGAGLEGTPGTIHITVTDPAGANDTHSLRIDADNNGTYELGPFPGDDGPITFFEQGTYSVHVQILDDDGLTATGATNVVIANAPPAISNMTNDGPKEEGTLINVTVTATDPAGANDPLLYSFDFDNNGTYEVGPQASNTAAHAFPDDGAFTVGVRVTDGDGGVTTNTTTVNVDNAPPTITNVSNSGPASEGAPVLVAVLATDPAGVNDPLLYSFDFNNDGIFEVGPQVSNLVSHTFADNGTFTVNVQVDDGDGATHNSSTVVIVTNAVPDTTATGPTNGVTGQPRTFTFGAIDGGTVDQATGFTYTVDWGDGNQVIPATGGNGAGLNVDHIYTAAGIYNVVVTATDKDNQSSAENLQITIGTAELQGATLAIGGSPQNDSIKFSLNLLVAGSVKVKRNGVLSTFAGFTKIEVYCQGGDDKVSSIAKIISPMTILGGDGNDSLKGGGGQNVLVGGPGSDILTGSKLRDILIGGTGNDKLSAKLGDDILIGGSTDWDANPAALTAILNEWVRTDADYLTRIGHLNGTQAGGANAPFLLKNTTVHDDVAVDTLAGSTDNDWYFTALPGGANDDIVKALAAGETVTTL